MRPACQALMSTWPCPPWLFVALHAALQEMAADQEGARQPRARAAHRLRARDRAPGVSRLALASPLAGEAVSPIMYKGARRGVHIEDKFSGTSVPVVEVLLEKSNVIRGARTEGARAEGARADGALVLLANNTSVMLAHAAAAARTTRSC